MSFPSGSNHGLIGAGGAAAVTQQQQGPHQTQLSRSISFTGIPSTITTPSASNIRVCYTSYGSNLCLRRFLAYIQGGTVTGNTKVFKAAADTTAPAKSFKYTIPYTLFFAKSSANWGGGGVAFLDSRAESSSSTTHTVVRCYDISLDQFNHVVAQENQTTSSSNINTVTTKIISDLIRSGPGSKHELITSRPWYGTLVYLGDASTLFDGGGGGEPLPMLTFTCHPEDASIFKRNPPGNAYLEMLKAGLIECGLTGSEAEEYLRARIQQ